MVQILEFPDQEQQDPIQNCCYTHLPIQSLDWQRMQLPLMARPNFRCSSMVTTGQDPIDHYRVAKEWRVTSA